MTKKPAKKKSQKTRDRHPKESSPVMSAVESSKIAPEMVLPHELEPVGTAQAIEAVITEDGKV